MNFVKFLFYYHVFQVISLHWVLTCHRAICWLKQCWYILHFGVCHFSYCLWTRKTFLTCHIRHFSAYFSICKSQKLLFLFLFFPPSSVTYKMYRRHNSLWTPNLRSISITNFLADVSFGQIGKERYVDKQCLYDHQELFLFGRHAC